MPRRGGPYPRLRLPLITKVEQGNAVLKLVRQGHSMRSAGAVLGLSTTTAWRRFWFLMDYYPYGGRRARMPIPPQRGTRACPRGKP